MDGRVDVRVDGWLIWCDMMDWPLDTWTSAMMDEYKIYLM
jgi:hypothetical protein